MVLMQDYRQMLILRAEENAVWPGNDGDLHPGLDADPPSHQAGGQEEAEISCGLVHLE